jgi:tetratricopeptide (TPR) repeat protein
MRPQLAAVLLLFTSAASSAAATPERWIELRSKHFLVLTDSNEKDARRIASQFERMRAVFHILLPNATADSGRITVLALKDKKAFQSIEPAAYLAKGQLDLGGLFLRTPDNNYILVRLDSDSRQEHPYATVYHEYTHLLNSKSGWLPLWINEGLAEFYQNTDIDDKEVRLGQASADDVLYLRQNRLLPLTTLLAVDHNSPYYHEEQKGSVFYAESWALTHYLIVNDRKNNTHLLHDYFADLAAGQDSVTAAQNAFGDLKILQKKLDDYVSQSSFSLFQLSKAFPVDESSFKVEAVSTADANAIRADVLVYDDRKDEALALIDDTLRDDPQNALAHETMGFLKMREGDLAAARKWYDEAVQLNSQSYLAQYYSAVLAEREGDTSHPAAIEASLLACIHLEPTFAPAYDGLAQLYSTQRGKLDEAHLMNARAVQLDPTNIGYRINAASLLMSQQQPDNAIRVLKEAERIAANPQELAMVRFRREQIEHSQAAMAKFKADHPDVQQTITANGEIMLSATSAPEPASDAGQVQIAVERTADGPHFPAGLPTGPQHIARGVVRNVKCFYPTILSLDLETGGKSTTYYVNDYLKVDYFNLNFVPTGSLNPCKDIDGMKAAVHYTAVTDKVVAGQIVRLDLTK